MNSYPQAIWGSCVFTLTGLKFYLLLQVIITWVPHILRIKTFSEEIITGEKNQQRYLTVRDWWNSSFSNLGIVNLWSSSIHCNTSNGSQSVWQALSDYESHQSSLPTVSLNLQEPCYIEELFQSVPSHFLPLYKVFCQLKCFPMKTVSRIRIIYWYGHIML